MFYFLYHFRAASMVGGGWGELRNPYQRLVLGKWYLSLAMDGPMPHGIVAYRRT